MNISVYLSSIFITIILLFVSVSKGQLGPGFESTRLEKEVYICNSIFTRYLKDDPLFMRNVELFEPYGILNVKLPQMDLDQSIVLEVFATGYKWSDDNVLVPDYDNLNMVYRTMANGSAPEGEFESTHSEDQRKIYLKVKSNILRQFSSYCKLYSEKTGGLVSISTFKPTLLVKISGPINASFGGIHIPFAEKIASSSLIQPYDGPMITCKENIDK